MISNCRQMMYRCDPTGRVERRIFAEGEEIPNGWCDSPRAAKAKPYPLITPERKKLVMPR
jgi:hypothetical protein